MSIQTYAILDNLPAPVTTGGTQYFTDVLGDVWVANPSVSSGAWQRARAVLWSWIYRSAAFNTPGNGTALGMDTAAYDPYGLSPVLANGIVLPLAGHWLVTGGYGYTAGAAGDPISFSFVNASGSSFYSTLVLANASGNILQVTASGVIQCTANTTLSIQTWYSVASRTGGQGASRTFVQAKYLGP